MRFRRILGRVAGPVGLTAAWGVRKALSAAYRKRTGRTPPRGLGDGTPIRHALLWSAVSAAALAIVEVLVERLFRHTQTPRPEHGRGDSDSPRD
ncbi:MAG: DUF4235 domain-containing protein [Actinomycetales bacterium]|nr:DUF4235 domain-containing protein [Actinomycetales bacterium]